MKISCLASIRVHVREAPDEPTGEVHNFHYESLEIYYIQTLEMSLRFLLRTFVVLIGVCVFGGVSSHGRDLSVYIKICRLACVSKCLRDQKVL